MGNVFAVSSHGKKQNICKSNVNITDKDKAMLELKNTRDQLNKYKKKVCYLYFQYCIDLSNF
jgi:hypothetical protein